MNDPESIRAEIKRILVDVLDLDIPPEQIRDNDVLFAHGMGVDSVEALEIVRVMEQRFAIQIAEDEIGLGMFQDVISLGEAVVATRARTAAGTAP